MTKIQRLENAFKRFGKLTTAQIRKHSGISNAQDGIYKLRRKYGETKISTVMIHNQLTGDTYALYRWRGK